MSMNPVLSIDYIAITVATTVKWGATGRRYLSKFGLFCWPENPANGGGI
jgi:hypothetical protein